MADVQVTVGATITPFQTAMEQVKAQAKQTGEAIGVNIGDRQGFREEVRLQRGIEKFTASLANAKEPIAGFAGALEGLASAFRITGGVFAGFAIGNAIREQLETAASSAQSFYDKTSQIFSLGNDSSKEFAQQAIKNFEDAQKAYGEEGFLAKLIYGKGQKQTIKNGLPLIDEWKQKVADANADIIRDQTAILSETDPTKKVLAQIDLIKDEYKKKIEEAQSPEEKSALADQQQAKINDALTKSAAEDNKMLDEKAQKQQEARQKEVDEQAKIQEERSKQQKLLDERGSDNPQKRLDAIEKEIEQNKQLEQQWETGLERERQITHEYELQNEKLKIQAEIQSDKDKIAKKTLEQSDAQDAVNSALNESRIFHGQSSSLRKLGLGGSVGSQSNTEQLKAQQEANKKLESINTEIADLNAKLTPL